MFTGFLPVAQTSSFHTNFWGTFSFMTYACQAAAFISPILHDNALSLSLSLSLFSLKRKVKVKAGLRNSKRENAGLGDGCKWGWGETRKSREAWGGES